MYIDTCESSSRVSVQMKAMVEEEIVSHLLVSMCRV